MMSKEDEIFDNFLRSKFGSKSFENKTHYWRNAQDMIAKERKRNSIFAPVIIGSVALVAAVTLAFLFTSTHSSIPSTSGNTLTASADIAGTTGTNTGYSSTASLTATSFSAAQDASTSKTQQADNTIAPEQNNTPTAAPVTSRDNSRNPKRKKNLKSMETSLPQEPAQQVIKENIQPGIIDINGKTLIVPFNTSTKQASFSKTNAYIAHAAQDQKSYLAVEAGITCYNPGSNFINAINGQVGIRYFRFLSPKLAISTGLSYARLHQDLPTRSYQSTDYDFGVKASAVNIQTQRLDYIELPVSVLYQLAPKHYLTTGASLGYVLQSSDKVTNNLTADHSNQNGYLNAINHWDAQFNIGYQYQLTRNLWIRATYHMGVTDISNNTLFKRTQTDTNKGLRLTIGYKIY